MPVDTWPTADEVRAFLRLGTVSADDELVIEMATAAAIDWGDTRTNHRYSTTVNPLVEPPEVIVPVVPARIHYAATLHASRLYKRRDSTDGTIGFGSEGVVKVGRVDPDIEAMYGSAGPMVVG